MRPSIETGFHAILNKYVIHTHSVFANILACSEEGKILSKNLFANSVWIDYTPPGEALTRAISKKVKGDIPSIIFLKNHGVIITAPEKLQSLQLHELVNKKIIDHFSIVTTSKAVTIRDIEFIRSHILFPDQVVYTVSDETMSSEAAEETIWAYNYIMDMLEEFKLTISFISTDEADHINNMESEQYRKGLTK